MDHRFYCGSKSNMNAFSRVHTFRLFTVLLDTTSSTIDNGTFNSQIPDTTDRGLNPLVIIIPLIFVIGLIVLSAIIVIVRRNKRKINRCSGSKGCKKVFSHLILIDFYFTFKCINRANKLGDNSTFCLVLYEKKGKTSLSTSFCLDILAILLY